MDWLFESLKANSASIRYVAGAIASLTGALFLWVCKIGGETSVFKWLSDIQTQRRAEAKAKIRIGLKSAQKESDEEKLDSLIVGLDQWKQLTNKLRGWKRSVRAGKWSIAALFITCFGLIASNILTTGYRVVEASFAVAWMLSFLVFLIYIAPLLLLAYNNGLPKAAQRPPEVTKSPELPSKQE